MERAQGHFGGVCAQILFPNAEDQGFGEWNLVEIRNRLRLQSQREQQQ
jgi:hypothetical protein